MLLLRVDADERRWPGRVVSLAVDEDLTVEGHLTGRARFTLKSLASRPIDGFHQRPDTRPRHLWSTQFDLICYAIQPEFGQQEAWFAAASLGCPLRVLGPGPVASLVQSETAQCLAYHSMSCRGRDARVVVGR